MHKFLGMIGLSIVIVLVAFAYFFADRKQQKLKSRATANVSNLDGARHHVQIDPANQKVSSRLEIESREDIKRDAVLRPEKYVARKPLIKDLRKKPVIETADVVLSAGQNSDSGSELSGFKFSSTIDKRNDTISGRQFKVDFGDTFSTKDVPAISQLSELHSDAHNYATWAPKIYGGELPSQLAGWKRKASGLVSFTLDPDRLSVFVGAKPPSLKALAAEQYLTRAATDEEVQAIKIVQSKGTQVINATTNPPIFVTPILAKQSCTKCHDTKADQLIGAFIHYLEK